MSAAQLNQTYQAKIGFGYRQLSASEANGYCNRTIKPSVTKLNVTVLADPMHEMVFENVTYLRIVLSGCYYLDKSTFQWRPNGVEVIETGTNTTHTHCRSNHLTEFAGGFIVLPDPISFDYAFANASFDRNPIIYATVITIVLLYIVGAIFCHYFDKLDLKKTGICVFSDQNGLVGGDDLASLYFYELIVLTGTRRDAATDSNVKFILGGDKSETDIKSLSSTDSSRKILRRGGVDSFIMSVKKPLGDLSFLRIWHDNSGAGKMASWFLKCVIVHDLQSRKIYYFICQDWLAVDKSDFSVDRMLPVSGDKQKAEFKYLLEKQAIQNLSDNHLWFSVLARPVQSAFTRLERFTCCTVLLFLSMLANIVYYGMDKSSSNPNALQIGPMRITPEQVGIGIMTNLIIFPPSFLLVQIFRRARRRVPKSIRLKKIFSELAKRNASVGNVENDDAKISSG